MKNIPIRSAAVCLLAGLVLAGYALSQGCSSQQVRKANAIPEDSEGMAVGERVSIEQIAVAIEKHITEKTEADGGYFHLAHNGRELRLKLVRVHMDFMALSRSVDMPSRFEIGVAIPSERDEGGIDGYHCWAEFYADGRWWPVDISEGDKYSNLATYYFGHVPANRLTLSRGRDLVVEPGPESGAINSLAYPLLEVSGRQVQTRTEFLFRRIRGASAETGGQKPGAETDT